MTALGAISTLTVRDAVARIGDDNHCQAGGATALSGALAAALAQATANSTLIENPARGQADAARAMQATMAAARADFLRLADQDANAILEYVALEARGAALTGYALLCDGPRDMAAVAVAAAQAMQAFRVHVGARSPRRS
ncbi:MAG: cyclodeaminase/cyclohydrolase family protein [Tetrasphaera sp.]